MAYWEVWEKRILNKPVTLQGKCKQEKNEVKNTETVFAHRPTNLLEVIQLVIVYHTKTWTG